MTRLGGWVLASEPGAWNRRCRCDRCHGTCRSWSMQMDWDRIAGNWKQVKGRIKEKWGNLTDDDLDKIDGRREQLEGKIQERYGVARDMVRRDLDDWLKAQHW